MENLNVFLGDHHKNFISRRGSNSYTSENMLRIREPTCENNDITTTKTSCESHLHWKNQFHENLFYFRFFADFEADKGIDNSSKVNKRTNIFKRNTVCNGFFYNI